MTVAGIGPKGGAPRYVRLMHEQDDQIIGMTGTVTLAISPSRPGEVMIGIRGGTEAFTAVSDETITKHARVVVIDRLSARTLGVTPLP